MGTRTDPAIPDYELIRLIGRGGYGDVWLARGVTGLLRAIKVVWRDRFVDSQPFEREFAGLKRFAEISLLEARQLALLHVGRNEAEGFFYYVMELADDINTGRTIEPGSYEPCTLREVVKRRAPLPAEEAIALGTELARGLAFLHSRQLVHRDIKPSNVILVAGSPKLADIGLVALAAPGQTFVGTEGYAAPEGPGAPAADVFGIGKLLYELSTGLDRNKFPQFPPNLSRRPDARKFLELNAVILRACEANPARRYRDAGALLDDLLLLRSGRSLRRRQVIRGIAAGVIGLGMIAAAGWAVALGVRLVRQHEAPAGGDALAAVVRTDPRSVAVLPFANLSPDPDNAFFADGIHEDLIATLAKIHDLRVTARTSVMAYRTGSRNLRTIAADLGVANILEGSVQRAGREVRVTAELFDAGKEQPIWADTYDEDLTDVFAIQSDLAEEIAAALRASLSPDEEDRIGRRPTQNQEAYQYYLRARAVHESMSGEGTLAEYSREIAFYVQALARDPAFGLAYARLSLADLALYELSYRDPTPARLERARAAAESALLHEPDLPEAKFALGAIAYVGSRDFTRALADFQAAEADLPNDAELLRWIGQTLRRLGRWDEAIGYFQRSASLDPEVLGSSYNELLTRLWLRQYSGVSQLGVAVLHRFPDDRSLNVLLAFAQLEQDGDRNAFQRRMAVLRPAPDDPDRLFDAYLDAVNRQDWPAAQRALGDPRLAQISGRGSVIADPIDLYRTFVAFMAGRSDDARTFADRALAYYRGRAWTIWQEPWALLGQARAEAFSGRSEEALRDVRAAWASVSGRDANDSVLMQPIVGQIYIALGRTEDAIDVLRGMMAGPSLLGPQRLRWDPLWSRLEGDPRFEALLRSARSL